MVLVALAAALPGDAQFTDNRIPDEKLVNGTEAKIVMPKGAGSLDSYDRTYTEAN